MKYNTDIAIIGAGHAGAEAALAAARMGANVLLFAINLDSIAMMPCNPNIGGTSKGHLVREIDALGGEMGKNIDKTFIQSRMLNTGKGPAVHSLRAQADKHKYSQEMKKTLENQPNISIIQAEVVSINTKDGAVCSVTTVSGAEYFCKCVVVACGTYLESRCIWGDVSVDSGPNGLKSSAKLADSLRALGITLFRFKTGTCARIAANSVDFSKMDEQKGDTTITPFSFASTIEGINRPQVSCYLTHTNEKTHQIIRENLHRSPMHSGEIEGVATRYCPSIEDKIVRFPDKTAHQVFIEPEGEDTSEMYVSGMSTSLPEDVQIAMYQSIKGLENCKIVRFGYAIEYDAIDATALNQSLEFKQVAGLFSAGQLNGTSGYEEAAAQGLIAGINAAAKILGKPPLVLDRSDGYIGVLIDDLTTKGTKEPYRMMTSRAEYRLLLRQDNADLRLTELSAGYLINNEQLAKIQAKKENIQNEIKRLNSVNIHPTDEINAFLAEFNSSKIEKPIKLIELIKRPELNYFSLSKFDTNRPALPIDVQEQVDISIKYEGYISKQLAQVAQFKKMEGKTLPKDINYDDILHIRAESRQKLKLIQPKNIGQASRIAGISPADISNLLIYLERTNKIER